MQTIQIDTEDGRFNDMDWHDIESLIIRLPDSTDTDFIVMSFKGGNINQYVQTAINIGSFINEGVYVIETRIPRETTSLNSEAFSHYRLMTDDTSEVINDFRQFYNGDDIDISRYNDVTAEF